MASIAQLVSEFAHSLGQPNNQALRNNIKSLIIHTRAEVIRRSYENHNYIDKGLTQRYRVSTVGYKTNREIPFIKETVARFRGSLPGMCGAISYDYINDYIYIYPASNNKALTLGAIVIESAFEHPNQIILENGDANELDVALDDNEWILSEDMVGQIKEIIYKRDLLNQVRQTDEVPNNIKF